MRTMHSVSIFVCCILFIDYVCTDNSTVLISKYAKVAHWGSGASSTPKPASEGRSSNGQTLWTHRSDARISSGQNLKIHKKPAVVYQYPVRKQSTDHKIDDVVGGVGEVQERFNPRPYFDYTNIPPKNDKPKPEATFPVYAKPPSYSSPFSSYNPPPDSPKPPDVGVIYPPNTPPPTVSSDTYASPPDSPPGGPYPANIKPDDTKSDTTLGPPLAPQEDHVFYPPEDHPHDKPEELEKPPDMAEQDLAPPPSDSLRFPPYLYSNHHYDYDHDHDHHHQIYHEVVTTVKPPPPEDQRVNKAHYSYYYLGRKLWYIPLYFSVYFVIYVTVLILKSIARHKVQFKNHFDDRQSRTVDLEKINQNVSEAINKYNHYIM